jgi:hypothetical protein
MPAEADEKVLLAEDLSGIIINQYRSGGLSGFDFRTPHQRLSERKLLLLHWRRLGGALFKEYIALLLTRIDIINSIPVLITKQSIESTARPKQLQV